MGDGILWKNGPRDRRRGTVVDSAICVCGKPFLITLGRYWNRSTTRCGRHCDQGARRYKFGTEHLTVSEICNRTDLKCKTVWKRIAKGDPNPFRQVTRPAPLRSDLVLRARERWRHGESIATIAREFGVHSEILRRAVWRELEVERRTNSLAYGKRRAP